jgi:hypothetical protein
MKVRGSGERGDGHKFAVACRKLLAVFSRMTQARNAVSERRLSLGVDEATRASFFADGEELLELLVGEKGAGERKPEGQIGFELSRTVSSSASG